MKNRPYELQDQPPVIQLLLTEFPKNFTSIDGLYKHFRKLMPELRRQAEWTIQNYVYAGDNHKRRKTGFFVTPTASLDPFSWQAKCNHPNCRQRMARQFARSLSLYADEIYLSDSFTESALLVSRWPRHKMMRFVTDWLALCELSPFLRSGLIRFTRPIFAVCESCRGKLDAMIADVTGTLVTDSLAGITVTREDDALSVSSGRLHEPSLGYLVPLNKRDLLRLRKGLSEFELGLERYEDVVKHEVRDAFLTARTASYLNSIVVSNSRLSMMSLRTVETREVTFSEIDVWEADNSAHLPWIRELSVEQVMRLRDLAQKALPRYRELVSRASGGHGKQRELVTELRSQVAEVEAELSGVSRKNDKIFQGSCALMTLGLAVYGIGGAEPIAAVSTLVSMLALAHPVFASNLRHAEKIRSKPGYVLVKAKEILAHD